MSVFSPDPEPAAAARALAGEPLRSIADALRARRPELAGDPSAFLAACMAEIDVALSRQLSLILHHPEFRALEASWRALHGLVQASTPDEDLRIRVLSIAKPELSRDLRRAGPQVESSRIFKTLVADVLGTLEAVPFSLLLVDAEFGGAPDDQECLRGLARVLDVAHLPMIAAAARSLAGWEEDRPGDPATRPPDPGAGSAPPVFLPWRSFRRSEDARLVALTLPRRLGRRPWGEDFPLAEFDFRETVDGPQDHLWISSAHALAECIARSVRSDGWGVRCRGPESDAGRVTGLIAQSNRPDGSVVRAGPTDRPIS